MPDRHASRLAEPALPRAEVCLADLLPAFLFALSARKGGIDFALCPCNATMLHL